YSFSAANAALAESTLGLGDRLQVMNVIPGTGAERAGLKRGDILVNIDGQAAPQGNNAEHTVVQLLSPAVAEGRNIEVTVSRSGSRHTLTVPLTLSCGFHVELGQSPNVTAFSDGNRIMVTQGMMFYAKNDESLAYVIAKEMAHSVLDHPRLSNNTSRAKLLIDNLIQTPPKSTDTTGLKAMSKRFDIDADSVSLAMLVRGGYSIDGTTRFWRNMAYHFPASRKKHYTSLHPEASTRVSVMPQSIDRIKAIEKRRKALPSTR
ncbi:MAG: M48 family metalloprotease, partial [Oxalobacter sp.]